MFQAPLKKKFKNKFKRVVIFLSFCLLAVLVGIWFARPGKISKREITPKVELEGRQGKIEISGVSVKDFLKGENLEGQRFITLTKTDNYHIFYIPSQELFSISILTSPFDEKRLSAEREFLKALGITEKEACKLSVQETTPMFVNSEEAGNVYGLSFCN